MKGKTLLYAEDDQETRENYTYVLKTLFETVYTAADGNEALKIYTDKAPDILLFDISMPGLDGLEAVRMIREDDQSTPIVMLSAHSERERLLSAVNLKLEAYLLKPIDDNLLLGTLKKIIEHISSDKRVYLDQGLAWDEANRLLLDEETPVKLTKKEIMLMELLGSNPGNYVSRHNIVLYVWSDEVPDETHDHKVTQLVYRLNAKIAARGDHNEPFIENGYARGYRLKTV
ncbi:MAG: response regulator transcription factor [Campylobacterota bacterium]|nr:response regulator transcription factor [Campylobacterota bacterium]